jgi:hypothetical protein
MHWLAAQLRALGMSAQTLKPEGIVFTEDGLFFPTINHQLSTINVLYRFYELFDLKNIPKSELVIYAAKKKRVVVTPPYKSHLEEKMLLALLRHPLLETYWRDELGAGTLDLLKSVVPMTWILDPRPVPPHAGIHGISFRGLPLGDWHDLAQATQKERRLVIKPSGFSPLAWGSRGVVIGHDCSQAEWAMAIERALGEFQIVPHVLQEFHEGKRYKVEYSDIGSGRVREMDARVRLSPYYFVFGGRANLCGALATACSSDKKLIHGMTDAVMAPCAVWNGI